MTHIRTSEIPTNPEFASTPEDDKRILDGVMTGDAEAGREFVQRWGRLARYFGRIAAEKTRSRTGTGVVDRDDLTQEAFLSMLESAPNYQSQENGARFSSYVASYMQQRLDRARVSAEHGVHISANAREMLNRIDAANDQRIKQGRPYLSDIEMAQMLNIPLSPSETGSHSKITVFDLINARGLSKFIGSIDEEGFAPNQDETPGQGYDVSEVRPMSSVVGDIPRTVAEEAEGKELRNKMDDMLATLDDRERTFVKLIYGYDDNEPKTMEEIAAIYGVTRERVRQTLSKAHSKLRVAQHHDKLLQGFLDS